MDRRLSRHFWKTRRPNRQNAPSADRSVGSALSGQVRPRDNGRGPTASARSPRVNLAALRTVKLLRHGSNAGHSSGVAGVDARRATPQIQGWRAGSSLAVASSTTANPLLSPAKIRELNHAAFVSLSYPTDRQVLRNPHIGRPGFLSYVWGGRDLRAVAPRSDSANFPGFFSILCSVFRDSVVTIFRVISWNSPDF